MLDFSDLLKSYRTRVGLSQTDLAEKLGVALRTYQGWEGGEKRKPLARTMLQRIVELLRLSETEADQFYRAAAQVAPELQNLPFQRNRFFTGRERYLKQLDDDFQKNAAVAITQQISISGLGGIGKTQLALEYAHRCHPEVYRTVLWVNASSEIEFVESYLGLARLLELPQQNESEAGLVIQAVKRWLEEHTSWLLILDNVDDLQLTSTFLPAKPRGNILLTTRSPILGNIAAPMMLEALEPEEGLLFLLRRSGVLSLEAELGTLAPTVLQAAKQLVNLLERHPLALDQAGAYIEEAVTSFEEYIQLYEKQRRTLLDKRGSLGQEHPETVVVTLEASFQRAREVYPLAMEVLVFCTFLAPDALPEEVFIHDEQWNLSPLLLNEAIGALRRYSLIKRSTDDRQLSIHRLVQAVLQDGMEKEALRAWAERVVLAVNAALPPAEYGNWPQCERLLPSASAVAEHIELFHIKNKESGRLCHEIAVYLQDRARYAQAEPFYQQALHIRQQCLGMGHPDVAATLIELADLYRVQNKYDKAEPLYEQALHIREQHPDLGPEHPDVAVSLKGLADLRRDQGSLVEAKHLYQHARRILEGYVGAEYPEGVQVLSDLGPSYAQVLNNLGAIIKEEEGGFAQAENLYLQARHIWERHFGLEHPTVANPLNNLAILYKDQRKYKEAESCYQNALSINEKLGPEHSQVAISCNNLGEFYVDLARYEEAEQLYQRALAIWQDVFGPEHYLVAIGFANLADVYAKQDRLTEAEAFFQSALALIEQCLGKDHYMVAYLLHGIGNLSMKQGKYLEAEALFQRALTIRTQALGPQHYETAESIHDLAPLRDAQGYHGEVIALYFRALEIRERAHGTQDPKTRDTRASLTALLRTMGRQEEAAHLEVVQSEQRT